MKRIVLIAAAVVLAGALTYAGVATHQKRELRAQVAELAAAAGSQLEEALAVDVYTPAAGIGERLDAAVGRADAALNRLRALGARRDPALVEAADPYLAGVLEVLRRQAGATRHRARFIEDRASLEAHMARAGARTEGWAAEAIRLRKALDQDHYDYQRTTVSLGNMLAGLVDARRKLSAALPAVPLPSEAAIAQAQERARAAAQAAKQELDAARRLISPG